MSARRTAALVIALAGAAGLAPVLAARAPGEAAASTTSPTATIIIGLDHPVNVFRPDRALGAGLDGHDQGDTARIYTRPNLRAMGSAGLGALSYRLRTELGVEAWHWNPRGRWSDPRRQEGYWTSSSRPAGRLEVSYGYRLPRRGDTIDQANDDGYSRLDDGNPRTFWKSNPYLDSRFTHESDARHPQWALVDLGRHRTVNALRIDWGAPYASRFAVQEWDGGNAIFTDAPLAGRWRTLPLGRLAGSPGVQNVRVGRLKVRYLRVLLLRSSHRGPRGSHDVRDRLGFAIRELSVGTLAVHHFRDLVRHAPSNARQSVVYVSSTDPWHRARDRDPHTEQPGFDRVFASGLTRGQPVLVPVAVLYGTPEDAAAELRFLRHRRYPVRRVELGEEPDGQLASPEDYGALYARFARALRRVSPGVRLGGPGFQTAIPDWIYWPNREGVRSWMRRFLAELRARRALGAFNFFSFEWYPFDDVCSPPAPNLARAPGLLADILARQVRAGLPAHFPKLITEYGYSAFAGEPEVDRAGALFNADTAGQFLALGGEVTYFYGYEPDTLIRESSACNTWGNLALLLSDGDRHIQHPLATYYGARLLTQEWAQPGDRRHLVLSTDSSARGPNGELLVSAYSVRRPDGRVAVVLVNKDPSRAWTVRLVGEHGSLRAPLAGPLDIYRLSAAEYVWHPRGDHGFSRPDRPPSHLTADGADPLTLGPQSLTVVRTAQPPDAGPPGAR